MNFFKTGLQSVLGTSENSQVLSGAETVERLVERVSTSSLLEDRRDACRALRSLSKKYRLEVGAQGIVAFIQILEQDRADCEIIGYCLDSLCNVMSPEDFEEEIDNSVNTENIAGQFTEIFIKNPKNVTQIINLLEEFDFRVRWSAIKLLTHLLANQPKDIQEFVLVSPLGLSKLMDLLLDSREIIRNDALLLLIQLTKGNASIQKIVAFENAFDILFDIITSEDCCEGGIVVEDCSILMLNLLKNNPSNQQFFKEGSYIQRLGSMFILQNVSTELDEIGMSPQKVANIHCLLQIVRVLISPNNSIQITSSSQKIMRECRILETLCNMLMGSGIPPDILTETICTVGEMIRGDTINQEYFNCVMAPSNPPRTALVVLLMSMVNEKQPLALRVAVLYCFQSYLYNNGNGQKNLVQTLLPSSKEVSSLTSGHLLCGGLFSFDSTSNWLSAVALLHALIENPEKEQLLRVLLATSVGSTPVSLLSQCVTLLQSQCKTQSKIGLLMLLSCWLSYCPITVKSFLSLNGTISFLIAQITANDYDENENLMQGLCAFAMGICIQFNDNSVNNYHKEDLCQLLLKRIGIETFLKKLNEVSKSESYSKAVKHPQIRIKVASDLILDYEFCKLFKVLEPMISLTVTNFTNGTLSSTEFSQESLSIVIQYKNIIRDQDAKLKHSNELIRELEEKNSYLVDTLKEMTALNAQTADHNILLQAQLGATMPASSNEYNEYEHQINSLKFELSRLQAIEDKYQSMLNVSSYENAKLLGELQTLKEERCELDKIKKDQEDLLELLTDQETQIKNYKEKLRALGEMAFSDDEV